jgi:hypothetical protein
LKNGRGLGPLALAAERKSEVEPCGTKVALQIDGALKGFLRVRESIGGEINAAQLE